MTAVSPLIRRVQLVMVAVWICVEVGADDYLGAQDEFDEALEELIEAPLAGPEDAALRVRCLAQVGAYYDGCTSTAARIFDALRSIAAGLSAPVG